MSEKGRILYSIDESGKHSSKKKAKKDKSPGVPIVPSEHTLKMRIEKKGRGGKSVTVVYELPSNDDYFKKLTKRLKAFCGCGGSYKNEHIEIQGDLRAKVRDFLEREGFSVKG